MATTSFMHVTIVAHLVELRKSETKYDFFLEDGTRGRITARQRHLDDSEDDNTADDIS